MNQYRIRHRTGYHYSTPVRLGPHRLMMRPRDSHDLDLRQSSLVISPEPASVRWIYDVWGNSVAIATFAAETDHLTVESGLTIDHFGLAVPELLIDEPAQLWPFEYAAGELPDLAPYLQSLYPDTYASVRRWAWQVLGELGTRSTAEIVLGMMRVIRERISYRRREEPGVQRAEITLSQGGTCRDLAVLMMESLRHLGFASRFVSGYLYDPQTDPGTTGATGAIQGGGATHAWLDVYLPGAGWIELDPSNGLFGSAGLVRVATARDPEAALPLTGSFEGPPGTSSSMTVDVQVERISG